MIQTKSVKVLSDHKGIFIFLIKILFSRSDPSLSFVLQFTAPKGQHLQSVVPSVLVQNAPKETIGQVTVLKIGDLNLLYEEIGFTVSVTNFTLDMTPTISPTGTIDIPSTKVPIIYSKNVFFICFIFSFYFINTFKPCNIKSKVMVLLLFGISGMFNLSNFEIFQPYFLMMHARNLQKVTYLSHN